MESALVNWGEAFRVAGLGFGIVFLILVILALATHAMGLALRRWGQQHPEEDSGKRQDMK